jgi:sulfopropanediol 3-dehydrogenase
MSIEIVKKASKTPATGEDDTAQIVRTMLQEIEEGGEEKAREYAQKLDGWEKEIILSRAEIDAAIALVPEQTKLDIQFSHQRVKGFAEAQLASMSEFEAELSPGLFAGQRLIPVNTAGCYVPGGRYAHIASAIMSITTARVAGVKQVIACSPTHHPDRGVHPAIVYAADLAGADTILSMGGVQGIAAMAFGLFTGHPADILVGPGNRFVAEAKRILFGRVGIDLFAGPTEILVIADDSADPEIVASDLAGQAEHGLDSPAWLVSTSAQLAQQVIDLMPKYIERMAEPNRSTAESAWRDYGEVVVVDSREEAVKISDDYAPEHLEVQCEDLDWWLHTNHILPTKGAARYTGGLSVSKFIKVLTWQRMTEAANREVGAVTARISRSEGMEGHARSGDDRLYKYFPGEEFDLGIE